jgi:hypothetical protein
VIDVSLTFLLVVVLGSASKRAPVGPIVGGALGGPGRKMFRDWTLNH